MSDPDNIVRVISGSLLLACLIVFGVVASGCVTTEGIGASIQYVCTLPLEHMRCRVRLGGGHYIFED